MALPSAVYHIKNLKSSTYFDTRDPKKIQGWESSPGSVNQEWEVRQQNDYYIICNVNGASRRYVSGSDGSNGTPVTATLNDENQASHWDITDFNVSTNTYRIYLKGTQGVIDLAEGKSVGGTGIHIWGQKAGHLQQSWKFEKVRDLPQDPKKQPSPHPGGSSYQGAVPPGKYWIRNAYWGTALDLSWSNANDGASIIGYRVNQGNNQQWELQPGGQGYRIRNIATGTDLSFRSGENLKDGVLPTGNRNLTTEWEVRGDQNGYSLFIPKTNYVLDLAQGSAQDGAKIYLSTNKNENNQKWILIRA